MKKKTNMDKIKSYWKFLLSIPSLLRDIAGLVKEVDELKLKVENQNHNISNLRGTIEEMSKYFSGHVDFHRYGKSMVIISFINSKGESEARVIEMDGTLSYRDMSELSNICKSMAVVHRDNWFIDGPPQLRQHLTAEQRYRNKRG